MWQAVVIGIECILGILLALVFVQKSIVSEKLHQKTIDKVAELVKQRQVAMELLDIESDTLQNIENINTRK